MSTDLIPFPKSGELTIPDYIQRARRQLSAFVGGITGGFPVLSIKGKSFATIRDGQRAIVMKPGDEEEPATAIDMVIITANPNLTRTYYKGTYNEDNSDKPTCYSNDGVAPAPDVEEKQAKTCALCPHDRWGSGNEGRGKACRSSRRVAVAAPNRLDDPLLLRLPITSATALRDYAKDLHHRGVEVHTVLTRLRFDVNSPTPLLTFKPMAFLGEATLAQVEQLQDSVLVAQIIGTEEPMAHDDEAPATPAGPVSVTPDEVEEVVASKPAKPAKPAPVAEPAEADGDDDEDEAPAPNKRPKRKAKAEAPAKQPAKAAEISDEFSDELDSLLDDYDD